MDEFLGLQPGLSPASSTGPGPQDSGLQEMQLSGVSSGSLHPPGPYLHLQAMEFPLPASPVPPHRLMVFDHHMKLGALVQGDALEVPLKALEEKEKRCLSLWPPRRKNCVWFTLVPQALSRHPWRRWWRDGQISEWVHKEQDPRTSEVRVRAKGGRREEEADSHAARPHPAQSHQSPGSLARSTAGENAR